MKKSLLLLMAVVLFTVSYAQQVMMQGWYWDYPKAAAGKSWADTLRLKAASLKQAGITHMWAPPYFPASSGANSNGYDPRDLFIGNTTTGVGTRAAFDAMMAELTAQGIAPVADMIYNHRDGGKAENNPAVKAYVTNYFNAAKEPFPSDRFRCILPLGGSSGNGAGDYYFKISSKTGDGKFYNFKYKLYMETNTKKWQSLQDTTEAEPNGGGDCGQANNDIILGRNWAAAVDAIGCKTDEFHLNLSTTDFNAAGDTLYIYLSNTEGVYSDHRIYGIWSGSRSADIVGDLQYQTYTDYTNMPSGRGQMNFNFFKPNDANASTQYLAGDWDGMYFFYDYDQLQPQTKDSLIAWTKWNWQQLGVRGLRMDAVKHFTPDFVSQMLNSMHADGMDPSMVVGEWYSTDAGELSGWVNNVLNGMTAEAKAAIQPKIFDFSLRENLRKACDEGMDTRNIFNGSLRDAAGLSGFHAVTFVNNHDFRDGSGFASLIKNNPELGYAYILTNNQLGVPTIFYPDYYGYPAPIAGGMYSYHPTNQAPLKTELDKLMLVLKQYINGSPSVDYLNRFSTPYTNNYISGSADKVLIYQLKGTVANGNRDVIVAINFGSSALKVDHQINTYSGAILPGTQFTDVLGRSAFPYALVNGSNQIYMELPAKSYSVWVQGTATVLPLQLVRFNAQAVNKVVQLQWVVAQNEEVKNFDVERSIDGVHFEKVGMRLSNNRSGNADYDFVDATPKKNVGLLYRLKLQGKDGSSVYSDIKLVRIDDGRLIVRMKQNPVQSNIEFEITATEVGKADLAIVSAGGQKVLAQTQRVNAGTNAFSLPATNLSNGIYQLVVQSGNERKVISFVKE